MLEIKEIITPSWHQSNVGTIEENHGGSVPQALEMQGKIATDEEGVYFTDETFEKRRSSGEVME